MSYWQLMGSVAVCFLVVVVFIVECAGAIHFAIDEKYVRSAFFILLLIFTVANLIYFSPFRVAGVAAP